MYSVAKASATGHYPIASPLHCESDETKTIYSNEIAAEFSNITCSQIASPEGKWEIPVIYFIK